MNKINLIKLWEHLEDDIPEFQMAIESTISGDQRTYRLIIDGYSILSKKWNKELIVIYDSLIIDNNSCRFYDLPMIKKVDLMQRIINCIADNYEELIEEEA